MTTFRVALTPFRSGEEMALVRGRRLSDTGDGLHLLRGAQCPGPRPAAGADQVCRRSLLRQRLTASADGLQEVAPKET
jgi:hypothetical protein